MFCTRYGTPIEPRNFNRSWDAQLPESRCAEDLGARRSAYLRLTTRRP